MDEKEIVLNGNVIGLYYCLGASRELSELAGCLEKIGDYLKGDSATVMDRCANVIQILNKWWCKAAACNGNKVDPISQDELDIYLNPAEMPDYMAAVVQAIEEGTKRMVKTKPIPAKIKNVGSGLKQ